MIARCKIGKGVTGAVRYVLGEGRDPDTGTTRPNARAGAGRVSWFGGTGFGFDIVTEADADLARRMMEFGALNQKSRTRLCEQDCVHIALGWAPGEKPTREEMERAAKEALTALGMANAEAMFAAHNDEAYAHLHIVASKINPKTGRAYNLKGNFLKLSKWAERYEREHSGGVVCARRAENNQLRDAIEKRNAHVVLELMTQRRATFRRHELDRIVSKQIRNRAECMAFVAAVLSLPDIVRLADKTAGPISRYTTKAVLVNEREVMEGADRLAARRTYEVPAPIRARVLGGKKYEGISREQARALRHVTGAEGLALIDGQAGTGKSFVMAAIREAYEETGFSVIGLAPTNIVAQDMKKSGFAHAATIHSELFRLSNRRTQWNAETVVMLDEAAMVDTAIMAKLTASAKAAGAKVILIGDDRQLSSVDRGGMYSVLKQRHGAAELKEVRRQTKYDDRRAAELMAEGNFHGALARYDAKGAVHWLRTQEEARDALVRAWARDSAEAPDTSRFVFAYTNADVDQLNAAIRRVRRARGEIMRSVRFDTKHGLADFSIGDRVQFTGTDKRCGIYNGVAGTLAAIDGSRISIAPDGAAGQPITFDANQFKEFRHGYAGTIYKGQGRTISATYLYHSEHWRSAASYVALTRHKDKAVLFVARNTAKDLRTLAHQMGRFDDRRAASQFHIVGKRTPSKEVIMGVWRLLARQLLARLIQRAPQRRVPRAGRRRERHL